MISIVRRDPPRRARVVKENAPANLLCPLTGERVRCFIVRRAGAHRGQPRYLIEAEGVQCIVSGDELEVW